MGIYMISPEVLSRIPRDRAMDMPELVLKLLAEGQRVCVYRFKGYWRDLGRLEEYQRGNDDFARMRSAFLGDGSA
jgi:NDP-sugar pyrophosphorylase family protein